MKDAEDVGMERLGYRPELDGLRGIAIALVVPFHLFGWPRSGGVGVDVFFVLSGFLITTLLIEEHACSGSISLRQFYARRALRLFPALAILILVSVVVFAQDELVGWSIAYVANWAILADPQSSGSLGHLWSLGIEEQFYLLWPALLLAALRYDKARHFIAGTILVSTGWTLLLTVTSSSFERVSLGTDTRLHQLAIGAGFALLWRAGVCIPRWLGWGGLVAIAAVALGRPAVHSIHVFIYPTVAIATGAVILASLDGSGLRRLLSARPLVWVGLLSYSLYLWHYFVHQLVTDGVMALALSVGLAVASHLLVERPLVALRKRLRADVFEFQPRRVLASQHV